MVGRLHAHAKLPARSQFHKPVNCPAVRRMDTPPQSQRLRLESVGFEQDAEAYHLDGNHIPPGGEVTGSLIMYLVRKWSGRSRRRRGDCETRGLVTKMQFVVASSAASTVASR